MKIINKFDIGGISVQQAGVYFTGPLFHNSCVNQCAVATQADIRLTQTTITFFADSSGKV